MKDKDGAACRTSGEIRMSKPASASTGMTFSAKVRPPSDDTPACPQQGQGERKSRARKDGGEEDGEGWGEEMEKSKQGG